MHFEKVYLMGNGRVADDCLRELNKRKIAVTYLEVTAEKFAFTRKLCERCGILFCHVDRKDIKQFLLDIQEKALIISAHNSYLFPAEVVEKKNLAIINLHIAYLPQYRGMNPSTWAIFNQESYTGATWHEVANGIDNGKILVQEKVPIREDDTAMKLMLRCFQTGIRLFRENLEDFLSGEYQRSAPGETETRLYLAKELPNQGEMDLSWDLNKIYAFLRSMDYTGADLMPLPRVRQEGRVYEIVKYWKETPKDGMERESKTKNDSVIFEFKEKELKIRGGIA